MGPRTDDPIHLLLATRGIVFALTLATLFLRLYRLDELPPGINQDEGAHGVDALRVLQGEHAVFFPRHGGREGMVVYAVALAVSLLGRTTLAAHLPAALAGAGTVFVVFWMGRLFFEGDERGRDTRWRSLTIGGVGAGLMAVSLSQILIGRAGVRANFLPLLLSLCFALLWAGWRRGNRWQVALAGACAGLLAYTYIPARFAPFLFLLFGLSFLPSLLKSGREGERLEKGDLAPLLARIPSALHAHLPMIGIFLGVAGLAAAPILLYFVLHPEHFFMRSDQLLLFSSQRSQGDPLGTLLENVWAYLSAFGFRGDYSARHNYPGVPILNVWEALFFWFGVAVAVRRGRLPAYRLLLFWLVVLILPAVLARDSHSPPSFLRMIGVMPAVCLLAGVGLWEAVRLLRKLERVVKGRLNLFLSGDAAGTAVTLGIVIAGFFLVRGINTYRIYFQEWAVGATYYRAFHGEWNDAVRVLSELPSEAGAAYLLPYEFDANYGFEFLYRGATPARVVHARTLDLPLVASSTLTAIGNVTTVKIVDWKDQNAWGSGGERIVDLLDKYGRRLHSDEHRHFHIHTYTDVALDRPWTLYDSLDPLSVRYDGGIDLRGLALGQGAKQYPLRQMPELETDRSLWTSLRWRIQPDVDVDYAVSLRLYDAAGERVFQTDRRLILSRLHHAHTSFWPTDEFIDTLMYLELPAELPAGEYEFRLVVYDADSMMPTVEIGVWEPETVLARLQFADHR